MPATQDKRTRAKQGAKPRREKPQPRSSGHRAVPKSKPAPEITVDQLLERITGSVPGYPPADEFMELVRGES